MRPCLYPSVETVESILQRAPPELTTAGRTETKPWWEEDRLEPSPIAPAPKPKPADQDSVSRPMSTAALVSEQPSEQTNPSDAVKTMRLVHKTYEDAKGYLVTEKVWCSVPKPESYPRTYPNPRIPEDNPGPDPLDPGRYRPGPPVPPRYPRRVPAQCIRSLRHVVYQPQTFLSDFGL